MLTAKERSLLEALEPTAIENGIEIVTVEVVGSRKAPTIRVYLDTPDGITFDGITAAQVWVNEIMDRLDPFPGAYTLEVSSPGIDRPLSTAEHFARFAGEQVSLTSIHAINERSKFTGKLKGYSDGCVELDVDGAEVRIPLEEVKKANVKGVIEFR